MARRVLLALCLASAALGCTDDEGVTLWVDVRTDLRAGSEFAAVEIALRGAGADRAASAPALATHDFLAGRRVAELSGLSAGDVTVHVALVDAAGSTVAQRTVELSLSEDTAVTVVITRDCIDVRCPRAGDAPTDTECHGGLCVDPRCHAGDSDACGTVECATDAMCTTGDACSRGTCAAGVCLFSTAEECNADAGVDAGAPDAGPPDAGTPDAGTPDAGRPCTTDHECPSGESCGGAGRCVGGCPLDTVDPYEGRPCARATLDCLDACSDEACFTGCLSSDPNPTECRLCYDTNAVSCVNSAGCQSEWNCYAACASSGGSCDAELTVWQACASSIAGDTCSAAIAACAS